MVKTASRHKRASLIAAVVVLVYAAALIAWTRGSSPRHTSIPSAIASRAATPSVAASSSGSLDKPVGEGGTAQSSVPAGAFPSLPDSALLNSAGAPRHSVVLTATSDGSSILRMGYVVADGRARCGGATNVASPIHIVTEGIGYAALAAFAVQASPDATYLTCSLAVDGRVRVQHTVHGGWSVVACVG